MRSSYLRSIAAIIVALGLTACGGKASFDVSGTINGLAYPGLKLSNGSDTVSPAAGATAFTFPNRIDYGTAYNIMILDPILDNPKNQTCSVTNGTGSAGHTATIAATVTCTTNTFALSGTVTGLIGSGLELANGDVPATIAAPVTPTADVAFTFPNVPFGVTYSVKVFKQPTKPDQLCTLKKSDGSTIDILVGTMGNTAITNILVSCVAASPG